MAVTYNEVKKQSEAMRTVTDKAVSELMDGINRISASDPSTRAYAIRRQVAAIAEKYGLSAQELGAQWYEYCAQKAGIAVEAALIGDIDYSGIDAHFQNLLDAYANGNETWAQVEPKIRAAFEGELQNLQRGTIIENLDRDYSYERRGRGTYNAGYARVPVGETCAWCYMLASLGYYYRSYESAGGVDPDRYHLHCDCVVVAYNDPEDIGGYDDYFMYKDMYNSARDAFKDNDYSDDMARRIEAAKKEHDEKYARGEYKVKWQDTNAIMMIMREQQGLSH